MALNTVTDLWLMAIPIPVSQREQARTVMN